MHLLMSDTLRLEPLTPDHAEAMLPVLADPALYQHLDYGPPPSLAHLRESFTRMARGRSPDGSEQWFNWVVRPLHAGQPGEPVGYVQATVIAAGVSWVAWVFGSRHWGRGLARQAAELMIEHLQSVQRIGLLLASAEPGNQRSTGLMQRLGMRPATPQEAAPLGLSPREVFYLRVLPVPVEDAPATGWRLQLADSELAAGLAQPDGRWLLTFSAAAMVSPEGVAGYARGVMLSVQPTPDAPALPALFGRIREGRVRLQGQWHLELPLPCTDCAADRIELRLPHGELLEVDLQALSVQLAPDWRFSESWAC